MTREIAFGLAAFGLVWLGYMAYVTGYQSGYDDGADMAMDKAEALIGLTADRNREPEEPLPFATQ